MEKEIILEINRLNELMNLPLLMETPIDWIKKLKDVVKGITGIAESEKTLLKSFIEGGSILGKSKEELITILRREDVGDDIIKALETKANSIQNATDKSEALSKVNELKLLKTDVNIADDLLKIKEWRHLDAEAKKIYENFTPYITPQVLKNLNEYKFKVKEMTLTPEEKIMIGRDLEACGLNLKKYINEHKLISDEKKAKALETANHFIKAGRWYASNPIKNTGKILGTIVGFAGLIYGLGAIMGGYKWLCSGEYLSMPFKNMNLCGGSNNGGGSTPVQEKIIIGYDSNGSPIYQK